MQKITSNSQSIVYLVVLLEKRWLFFAFFSKRVYTLRNIGNRGKDMVDFFKNVLNINFDGILSVNEVIAFAIVLVLIFILVILAKKPIGDFLNRITPGRKKTIFSHRKNQYKNRIGKKSKSSKNKK